MNSHSSSPVTGIDWGLYAACEDPQVPLSPIQEALAYVAENSLNSLDEDLSEDELVERLSVESSSLNSGKSYNTLHQKFIIVKVMQDDGNIRSTSPTPRKRSRNHTMDPKTHKEWYPWQDRIVSTVFKCVDKLPTRFFRHVPSTFSCTYLAQSILRRSFKEFYGFSVLIKFTSYHLSDR